MPIRFDSTDQAQKVATSRKTTRPSYFDATLGQDTEISMDMEAALILIPNEARQEARQRIDHQTEQTDRTRKRDAVLGAALQVDFDNASAQIHELENKVTSLQNFTDKFAKFASVGEIGTLLRDTQLGIDEFIMRADRAKNRQVMASLLRDRVRQNGISEELDQERKSWTRVLTEYSGV